MTDEAETIVLTEEEAGLAFGWSLDRDWPPLSEDEQALQDRLRPFAAREGPES